MDSVVLGLLMIRPMTSYEINAAFKAGLSMIYSASYGSIQAVLKKLLKSGMAEYTESIESGRLKKTYTIKEKGRIEFYSWMNSRQGSGRIQGTVLSKIYFLGVISTAEERVKILQNISLQIKSASEDLELLESLIHQTSLEISRARYYPR